MASAGSLMLFCHLTAVSLSGNCLLNMVTLPLLCFNKAIDFYKVCVSVWIVEVRVHVCACVTSQLPKVWSCDHAGVVRDRWCCNE